MENEKTAFYAEYNNRGEGAATTGRVGWSQQLTKKETKRYRVKEVLAGWKPVK